MNLGNFDVTLESVTKGTIRLRMLEINPSPIGLDSAVEFAYVESQIAEGLKISFADEYLNRPPDRPAARTPSEMRRLVELRSSGCISGATFQRSLRLAQEDFDREMALSWPLRGRLGSSAYVPEDYGGPTP